MRVVIHIPARSEWRAILALLPEIFTTQLVPVGEYGLLSWPAEQPQHELMLLRGGVGKIRAAASTQYAICTWRPDFYIVMGTAGAVDPALQELDLIWASQTLITDFRLGLTSTTTSTLTSDHQVTCPHDWAACTFGLPVKPGLVATADADVTHETVAGLYEDFQASIADWESGAVAYICALNAIPWLVLRGVSDTPTQLPDHQFERYRHNTPLVMQRLWSLLPNVLSYAQTLV